MWLAGEGPPLRRTSLGRQLRFEHGLWFALDLHHRWGARRSWYRPRRSGHPCGSRASPVARGRRRDHLHGPRRLPASGVPCRVPVRRQRAGVQQRRDPARPGCRGRPGLRRLVSAVPAASAHDGVLRPAGPRAIGARDRPRRAGAPPTACRTPLPRAGGCGDSDDRSGVAMTARGAWFKHRCGLTRACSGRARPPHAPLTLGV